MSTGQELEQKIADRFNQRADHKYFPMELDHTSRVRFTGALWRLAVHSGIRVLDAGCGTGRLGRFMEERIGPVSLVSLDAASALLEHAPGERVVGSLTDLPFPDDSFDRVLAIDALAHAVNTQLALRELARVTRPGGGLAVIDKNLYSWHPRWPAPSFAIKRAAETFGLWHYPRGFGFRERWMRPRAWSRILREAGCEVGVVPLPSAHRGVFAWPARLFPGLSFDMMLIARK